MEDKKSKNKRDLLSRFRVNQAEKAAIKANAIKAGLSVSEFQRKSCLEPIMVVKDNLIDKEAIRQLLAIGNNLNQLTKHAHVHREYDSERLHSLLDRIESLVFGVINGS